MASAPSFWVQILPQKYAEIAHMLLENGADSDVDARNKNGATPFVLTFQGGLAEITHVLVKYGADPNAHESGHNNVNWISFWSNV